MAYHIAEIHAHRDREDELASLLLNCEAQGVSAEGAPFVRDSIEAGLVEEWDLGDLAAEDCEIIVKGYFPTDEHWRSRRARLETALAALATRYPHDIYETFFWILEDEDWQENWKQYYKPLRVGERLVIKPQWESYESKANDIVVELDPGLAFGTGDHPTTDGALRLLEEYVQPDWRVLDIGCGSGILSVAAALLGAKKVTAVDNDRQAIRATVKNSRLNGVLEKIDVQEKDMTRHSWAHMGQFDLIVANIIADVIQQLILPAAAVLREGRFFIAGGIIRDKEKLLLDCFHDSGMQVREIAETGDWVTLVAQKPFRT